MPSSKRCLVCEVSLKGIAHRKVPDDLDTLNWLDQVVTHSLKRNWKKNDRIFLSHIHDKLSKNSELKRDNLL